ncbi:MAG: hypothetical protein IZT59_13505, partial [Verrucomicrobia bacterium]|nr:hypothetical protein [Verrucomicrobiota bacterium]
MNMRLIIKSVLVGAIVVCATASTRAEVKLNSLFTDNMVLQRDIPAKVFGTADDGESVIVSINGQTAKTTAKGGEWLVALKPMKAGGPHRLTIEGKNTLTLQNVVFGDVWLCTGQSNMDFDCARFASPENTQDEYLDEYGEQRKRYIEIAKNAASYKNLRMFVAEKRPGAKRAGLEAVKDFDQSWQVSSEKYTLLTSAMGYVFGLRLHQHLNIPIG